MSEVIAFRNKARRGVASEPPPDGAEILFFLGVRYVRNDDESDGGARHSKAPTRSSSTRTRRKKRA